MASSKKIWEPYHFSAEALKEQRRQLRGLNGPSSYDDTVAFVYTSIDDKPGQEKTKMASSSKNWEPYQISAEELEQQNRKFRCINRGCSYGDTLFSAVEEVCAYYDVDYKPGKEICITCLKKYLNQYKYPEKKSEEEKKKENPAGHA